MDNAWLDSLSEDWISQPRSSDSPPVSLPSLSNSTQEADSSIGRGGSSRIPLYRSRKHSTLSENDSDSLPLSERSANHNNIPPSQRALRRPSKLRNEISNGSRGRMLSRTVSASSAASIQHHTVQHKSLSASPKKSKQLQDTPEWKRRLLHGDVAYGEQRDLFSPVGLENMFRPPPPSHRPTGVELQMTSKDADMTMPSSPPPYMQGSRIQSRSSHTTNSDGESEPHMQKGQKSIMYRLTDMVTEEFSENDLSQGSSFASAIYSTKKTHQDIQGTSYSPEVKGIRDSEPLGNGQLGFSHRLPSEQVDIRHEGLSPIFISRHNTVDGKIDYAALDLPAAELQQRLSELTIDQRSSSSPPNDHSQSMPQDESANTDDFAHNGNFVNVGRGGYSQEGSFQRRMLSPSSLPAIDESAIVQEESIQASTPKRLPQVRVGRFHDSQETVSRGTISPIIPSAPRPSPVKDAGANPDTGSPLKLFGNYDTFTNQKLLRRLSQFENSLPKEESHVQTVHSNALEPGSGSVTRTEMNEAYIVNSSLSKQATGSQHHDDATHYQDVSNFGSGDLDQYEFSEEISREVPKSPGDEGTGNFSLVDAGQDRQILFTFDVRPPTMPTTSTRAQKVMEHNNTRTGDAVVESQRTARRESQSEGKSPGFQVATPRKHGGLVEGKRLPRSPLKDPTPKRRRTLHKTDIEHAMFIETAAEATDSIKETHYQMQSVIGKKRKDARYDDDQKPVNPEIMAMRQVLRPRTPTSSQRSSRSHDVLDKASLRPRENVSIDQKDKIARIQAELDSTEPLRTSFGIESGDSFIGGNRKGSVTTQDFLDEAKKIMAGIRGKARPSSGLASVEESETERDKLTSIPSISGKPDEDDSFEESTKEPFSRPPSREGGGPLPRMPKRQEDPDVLSHLRRYEESSEIDGMNASSTRSIDAAKAPNTVTDDRIPSQTGSLKMTANRMLKSQVGYESDPPNIHITEYPELQRKRKHSTSSASATIADRHDVDFNSHGSNTSSGQSTGRSIPTGSSRGSDSRRVIAPHTVSHLIPEQLAGMEFDRNRHIWVKKKSLTEGEKGSHVILSDDTDDDPFGDIPDLTVDETQEMQRLKAVAARKREEIRIAEVQLYQKTKLNRIDELKSAEPQISNGSPQHDGVESKGVILSEDTSSLTYGHHLLESQLKSIGNRDSSGAAGDDDITTNRVVRKRVTENVQEEIVEEAEEEISIHESRVQPLGGNRLRNVTIAFSSPLASIIQDDYHIEAWKTTENGKDIHEDIPAERLKSDHKSEPRIQVSTQKGLEAHTRTSHHSTTRTLSLGGQKFIPRPISRIDERDEDSFSRHFDDKHLHRSVSVIISTPIPPRLVSIHDSTLPAPSAPRTRDSILQLSPLSDFTIHQPDESFAFEASYIMQRERHQVITGTKRTLSLSIKELVQRITDFEPYEPFWEFMKQLDLKGNKLQTLHMLSQFCGQVEELDVSSNEIRHLDGAPGSVRHLSITHNLLSDLTSWHHLGNLQYIDVSNNDLTSLEGFRGLVHLRALRADCNKIESLNGVLNLDGLISLRLRGNLVQSVDFEGSSLPRLTELDLKDNIIREFRNLPALPSLTTLNLENNNLDAFGQNWHEILWSIKYLKLAGNKLDKIDVGRYPNLRLLYLDRNRLGQIHGLLKTKHLDSISLREQDEGPFIDPTLLDEGFEVRKLFLSGNLLSTFTPHVDFLNLQFLELANSGLETLPLEFGQMVANVRVLNMNFNALRDIKPLLGIVRLKKVYLAGNRLTRLRKTTNVLAQFSSLSKVDLRSNPLTLGFYPPTTDRRIIVRSVVEKAEALQLDPFTLDDADREADVSYAARLDMETKMRRRVFEMLMLSGCDRLRMLDGLVVDRSNVHLQDRVWDELQKAGVVSFEATKMSRSNDPVLSPGKIVGESQVTEDPIRYVETRCKDTMSDECWQAEDSFG